MVNGSPLEERIVLERIQTFGPRGRVVVVGQTQTGGVFPTTIPPPPMPPEQPPPPEDLVSVSPEQALEAGAITQQQFEEATRPELITAVTSTGETFQRLSSIPITPEEGVVSIRIPGQAPQFAPEGFVLTTPGGPRQVSFTVSESLLRQGVTPREISAEELRISRERGRFIRQPPGGVITDIRRPPPPRPTEVTQEIGGRVQITPRGIEVTPVTPLVRAGRIAREELQASQEELSRALSSTFGVPEVEKLREFIIPKPTPLTGFALKALTRPPVQTALLIGQEVGPGFALGAAALVPAVAFALTRPELLPSAIGESIRQLPRRAIAEPAVLAGEILFGLALGEAVGIGAGIVSRVAIGRISPRLPRLTFELGEGFAERGISLNTRAGRPSEFITERLDIVTDSLGRRPLPRASGIRVTEAGEIISISETFADPGLESRLVSLVTRSDETIPIFSRAGPGRVTGVRRISDQELAVRVEPGRPEQFPTVEPLPEGGTLRAIRQTTPPGELSIVTSQDGTSLVFPRAIEPELFTSGQVRFFKVAERRIGGTVFSRDQILRFIGEDIGGPGEELLASGGGRIAPRLDTGVRGAAGVGAFGEPGPIPSPFPPISQQAVEVVSLENEDINLIISGQQRQALSPISRSLLGRLAAQNIRQLSGQTQTSQQRQLQRDLMGQRQELQPIQIQRQLVGQRQIQRQQVQQVSALDLALQQQLIQQTGFASAFAAAPGLLVLPPLRPPISNLEDLLASELLEPPPRIGREPSLGGVIIGGRERRPRIDTGLGIRLRLRRSELI